MTLFYPYTCWPPVIWISIENQEAGKATIVKMLLDTGSCFTCLPTTLLAILGHQPSSTQGTPTKAIGATVARHPHIATLGLLDPKAELHCRTIIWRSALEHISFIEEPEMDYGLIGMDVIGQWAEFAVLPVKNAKRGQLRITTF